MRYNMEKQKVFSMAKNETLHIRVNEDVRSSTEATLGLLGMSISEAVNIFLCQVNLVGGIPFEVRLAAPERVLVRNKAELAAKLTESERDIAEGRVSPADEDAFERLESKYDL